MYDKLTAFTFTFPARALSTAGTVAIPIPAGATMARVMDVSARLTTATTVAAATITVGTSGDAASMAVLEVPVAANGTLHNGRTAGSLFRGVWQDDGTSGTDALQVSFGGESTAGAADVIVTIGFDFVAAD